VHADVGVVERRARDQLQLLRGNRSRRWCISLAMAGSGSTPTSPTRSTRPVGT
jgi:hypothetical protein